MFGFTLIVHNTYIALEFNFHALFLVSSNTTEVLAVHVVWKFDSNSGTEFTIFARPKVCLCFGLKVYVFKILIVFYLL